MERLVQPLVQRLYILYMYLLGSFRSFLFYATVGREISGINKSRQDQQSWCHIILLFTTQCREGAHTPVTPAPDYLTRATELVAPDLTCYSY